ncbi:hypothetical protein BGZ67_002624 [Mortierella alpina]|nr:hypothetical protein BGZ67_002624 [Mortierella alpina]
MTHHTETSTHKPSAAETLKDKATNLVNKVTGKSHGHDNATHTHTEPLDQHKHNPAAATTGTHQDHHHVPATATTGTHQDHHHVPATATTGTHQDHHHTPSTATSSEHDKHNADQGKINPSAFLTSVRLPDATASTGSAGAPPPAPAHAPVPAAANVPVPSAVHDPSHPHGHAAGHTEAIGSHIPTHAHNATATAAGIAPSAVGHEHGHHKVDDPQHEITSRLVGEGRDPNNLESAHIKPTM